MFTKIHRWLLAPSFEGDDDKTRVAALLNAIVWTFIIVSVLYAIFAPIEPEEKTRRIIIIVPFILGLLIIKQIINWGRVRPAGTLIVVLLWLVFTVAMALGADYKLAKASKVYTYFSQVEADKGGDEDSTFGIGMEHKF